MKKLADNYYNLDYNSQSENCSISNPVNPSDSLKTNSNENKDNYPSLIGSMLTPSVCRFVLVYSEFSRFGAFAVSTST